MGNLIKETPYSEITATIEILDHFGVGREDLKNFRNSSADEQKKVVALFTGQSGILNRIYSDEEIIVGATTGEETIANADDVFAGWIDSDFKNWNTNKPCGRRTEPAPTEMYELHKNATLRQMFGSLSRDINALCWEQGQIINFVQEHQNKLHPKGWATLLLFKVEGIDEPFVAYVYLGGGGLGVDVDWFGDGHVWDAEYRSRVVVPQLET